MGPWKSALRAHCIVLLLGSVLAVGCGGSGGDGSGGGAANLAPGSVALTLTDAPSTYGFSRILLTVTEVRLIAPHGQVVLFEGHEVIDLRDLEDASKLFVLGREIPAGTVGKVRIFLDDVELIREDAAGVVESIRPRFNQKLDLNPRGALSVSPGELLLVQIDFDATRAIHFAEAADTYNMRPVVFVDAFTEVGGRLVLLAGEIESIDPTGSSLLLCRSHPVSLTEARGGRITLDPGDGANREEDFCIDVEITPSTSIFDVDGEPALPGSLMEGDQASVLGRFLLAPDESLVFESELVQQGPPDTALRVDGWVATAVDPVGGTFTLDLDPASGFGPGVALDVRLRDATRIYTRAGEPLEVDEIQPGREIRVTGLVEAGPGGLDVLKATIVVLGPEEVVAFAAGGILGVEAGGARIQLATDEGELLCVDLSADTELYRVSDQGEVGELAPLESSDLMVGERAEVYGSDESPCFLADSLLMFADTPLQGRSVRSSRTRHGLDILRDALGM